MELITTTMLTEEMRTMKNDNLQEIKGTLHSIRSEHFSDVSSQIIDQIVDIQFENQEKVNRTNGRAQTQQVIRKYIDQSVQG